MAAQIITSIQSKGGAGKTTLLILLAFAHADAGARVCLLDADPQKSLSEFFEQLQTGQFDYANVERDEDFDRMVNELRDRYDVILIDTPGFEAPVSIAAAQSADLILIPCGKSRSDVVGAIQIWTLAVQHVRRAKSDAQMFVVLNHFKNNGQLLQTLRKEFATVGAPVLSGDLREVNKISEMMLMSEPPDERAKQAFTSVLGALQMEAALRYCA